VFFELQDRVVFFDMVWAASEWNFEKEEGFIFKLSNHTKHSEQWNKL